MYVIYNSQYVLYPYRYIDIWTPYEILDSHNLTTRTVDMMVNVGATSFSGWWIILIYP